MRSGKLFAKCPLCTDPIDRCRCRDLLLAEGPAPRRYVILAGWGPIGDDPAGCFYGSFDSVEAAQESTAWGACLVRKAWIVLLDMQTGGHVDQLTTEWFASKLPRSYVPHNEPGGGDA